MCTKNIFLISAQVIVLMLFCPLAAMYVSAANPNQSSSLETTITVIGSGPTEEAATLQALRSAIEQTYGAFVSSNSTILNDELVKDEIVSISSGNVKKYEKLDVTPMPNGQVSVSLNATVSISNLISYAQSKGETSIQFSGNAMAANIKLMELRASSTTKALENLNQELSIIGQNMYDFGELKMTSQPTINTSCGLYKVRFNVCVYTNEAYYQCVNFLLSSLRALSMSSSDYNFCERNDISCCKIGYTYFTHGGPQYRPSEIWYFPVHKDEVMSLVSIIERQKRRYNIDIPKQLSAGKPSYGCGQYGIRRLRILTADLYGATEHVVGPLSSYDGTLESHTWKKIVEFDDCLKKIQSTKKSKKKINCTKRLIQTDECELSFDKDKLSDFDIKLEY